MNRISVKPILVREESLIDRIEFKDCVFIDLKVDDNSINKLPGFEDALVFFQQLKASEKEDGKFLIFTCACGVADDGGWRGVKVSHKNGRVRCDFIKETSLSFEFSEEEYSSEIASCRKSLEKYSDYPLEPHQILYPEDW